MSSEEQREQERLQQLLKECHLLVRNDERLSSEMSFEELSKVLFMKKAYEQPPEDYASDDLHKPKNNHSFFNYLHQELDVHQSPEDMLLTLFHKANDKYSIFGVKDTLRLKTATFLKLAERLDHASSELYQTYDSFLTRVFNAKTEQIMVPSPLIDFIVEVLNPQVQEKVINTACSVGSFLVKVGKMYRQKSLPPYNMFGTDLNSQATNIARLNLFLQGYHSPDHIYNVNGLKPHPHIKEESFDVAIVAPPFGLKARKDEVYDYATYKYPIGQISGNYEVLYLERALHLLRPGGRMGIILPESIFNSDSFSKVRAYVESKAKICLIVSLPNDAFASVGLGTKTSLLFLSKFSEEEAIEYDKIAQKAKQDIGTKKENEEKVMAEIKTQFDYEFAIAEVEKIGISRLGRKTDNDLPEVLKEFNQFAPFAPPNENFH
ncbi:N-6 DNA methylase [uncultured Microscilla sp.]|uniref:HsdM family class I SAM-dependent methyltransferase n=1 Tax=uncultured Microscilla sp. TaxID=432653 RepID=UPI00261D00FA|nr:N-6 DNA methylase [uncultured Microscilla sp.]